MFVSRPTYLLTALLLGWLVLLTIGMGWLLMYGRSTGSMNEVAVEESDVAALQTQVTELRDEVTELKTVKTATSPGVTVVSPGVVPISPVTAPTTKTAQQFIIALGNGQTSNRDWTPTAAEVNLNPANYPPITKVHWEAAGSIIGGNVEARLVDVTHNRVYYEAPLNFNTSSPTWQQSGSIQLSSSPAIYRVEIRSSSGEIAKLHDSRLVIDTQSSR